jgi:hypothetical protein
VLEEFTAAQHQQATTASHTVCNNTLSSEHSSCTLMMPWGVCTATQHTAAAHIRQRGQQLRTVDACRMDYMPVQHQQHTAASLMKPFKAHTKGKLATAQGG